MKSNLSIFSFAAHDFRVLSKNSLLNFIFSMSFIVLALAFRSLVHFELFCISCKVNAF